VNLTGHFDAVSAADRDLVFVEGSPPNLSPVATFGGISCGDDTRLRYGITGLAVFGMTGALCD